VIKNDTKTHKNATAEDTVIDITKILSGEEWTALAEAGNVHP
jgi:hypothetical protein